MVDKNLALGDLMGMIQVTRRRRLQDSVAPVSVC